MSTTVFGPAFHDFTRALDALVTRHDARVLPALARPLLEALIADMSWLPDDVRDDPEGYAVIHADPQRAYVIKAFRFDPGSVTPVHDHATWGLVGVYDGVEREEKFLRIDDGSRAGEAELRSKGEQTNAAGTVSELVPPHDNVHRLWNDSATSAFSIHVYGSPPATPAEATTVRFDLETGRTIPWAASIPKA